MQELPEAGPLVAALTATEPLDDSAAVTVVAPSDKAFVDISDTFSKLSRKKLLEVCVPHCSTSCAHFPRFHPENSTLNFWNCSLCGYLALYGVLPCYASMTLYHLIISPSAVKVGISWSKTYSICGSSCQNPAQNLITAVL